MALSHYRSGAKPLRAYHILKGHQLALPKSRYLLAKCCIDLKKYGEAESTLTAGIQASSSSSSSSSSAAAAAAAAAPLAGLATGASSSSSRASGTGATGSTAASATTSASGKTKLYDEIVKEYGTEYSPHVLNILATVYAYAV